MTEPHAELAQGGSSVATSAPRASVWLPTPLAPFADPSKVRTSFPLFLVPAGWDQSGRVCIGLGDLLPELVHRFAPGADQQVLLKDNLLRLERQIALDLAGQGAPVNMRVALVSAGESLLEALQLAGDPAQKLSAGLSKLAEQVPENGRLLPYTPAVPLQLMAHAARLAVGPRRQRFIDSLAQLRKGLGAMVAVERANAPEAAGADALLAAVGEAGGASMDLSALSALVGVSKGSIRMPAQRLARIEKLLASVDAALVATPDPVLTVVLSGQVPMGWVDEDGVEIVIADDPSQAAVARFDAHAQQLSTLIGVQRAAQLELDGLYRADVHDSYLDSFGWTSFTEQELLLVPPVVAVEQADRMAGGGVATVIPAVSSGRPVQFLVEVQPARNPAATDGDPLAGYRLELGLMGVGLRQVYVQQAVAARADHLVEGIVAAFAQPRPGLHVVATGFLPGGHVSPVGAWLTASAAVDARAHALFHYDPSAGDSWAECMDASANPDPENDWPVESGDNGDAGVAFTFADYALLDPALAAHFRPATESDKTLPVADWLAQGQDPSLRPVVSAVADDQPTQLVVSSHLAFACGDRVRAWHMLRELAGIANEHARKAAAQARNEAQAQADAERETLIQEHAAQIEAARAEAGAEAMEQLARVLLDADLSAMPMGGGAPRPAAAAAPAPTEDAPAEAAEAPAAVEEDDDEDLVLADPWIDSALCTTCNDCINMNQLLFVYNDNKQAMIGDPDAGSFAQLVEAAEKCPSNCIHPGKPRNPSESGLDALIERAAKFQ